jgi:hypothetical protein
MFLLKEVINLDDLPLRKKYFAIHRGEKTWSQGNFIRDALKPEPLHFLPVFLSCGVPGKWREYSTMKGQCHENFIHLVFKIRRYIFA